MLIDGKKITLFTRFSALQVEENSRKAKFNGITIWLNRPIGKSWRSRTIAQSDVNKTIKPLLNPQAAVAAERSRIVVLDAGHGGKDKGATNYRYGIREKDLTLKIAKSVRAILQRYKIKVELTRNYDQPISLAGRCLLAKRKGADLFVSIHFNSAAQSRASGIETFIIPPAGSPITASSKTYSRDRKTYPANKHDKANIVLGYLLQKSLLKHTRAKDRGVRRARFYMVRGISCPSALVECGFISNKREAEKILTASYRYNIAKGIAEGILAYLNMVQRAHVVKPRSTHK